MYRHNSPFKIQHNYYTEEQRQSHKVGILPVHMLITETIRELYLSES